MVRRRAAALQRAVHGAELNAPQTGDCKEVHVTHAGFMIHHWNPSFPALLIPSQLISSHVVVFDSCC